MTQFGVYSYFNVAGRQLSYLSPVKVSLYEVCMHVANISTYRVSE
jgi:hypothetical protein